MRPFEILDLVVRIVLKRNQTFFKDTEKYELETPVICRKKKFLSVKLNFFYRTSFLKLNTKNVIVFSGPE